MNRPEGTTKTKTGLTSEAGPLGRSEVAIEVKGSSRIDSSDVRPLKAFIQEHRPAQPFVVCNERLPRVHEGIRILPWREFLKMLWEGALIS